MTAAASSAAKLPRIEVVGLKTLPSGNLKAFASIKIGPLTLHDFRIVQQPGQRAYVSVPQRSYQDTTSKTKYSPACEMPPEWKDAITSAVLQAWQATPGMEEDGTP